MSFVRQFLAISCFLGMMQSSYSKMLPMEHLEGTPRGLFSSVEGYIKAVLGSVDLLSMDMSALEEEAFHFFSNELPKPEELYVAEKPELLDASMSDSPLVQFNTPEMIRYYGYEAETHYVTTKDGYNLEIHRIPFGKKNKNSGQVREPVIIQHGILCSSADWCMNPPQQSIAYLMADAGYDVWLPNLRGNTYSKTHMTYKNNQKEFWQFSWDDMGNYDMPAIIDYILEKTGFPQLHYVAHSMGTTTLFTMMDKHPQYNDKIKAFYAMAPVTAVDNMGSPVHIISPFVDMIAWWLETLHIWEFAPSGPFMEKLATWFCDDDDYTQFICTNIVFLLCGYNGKQLNSTMLPVYISHTPAGTSTKTLVHYGQTLHSALFRQYDYGKRENEDNYGNTAPPLYDLKKTTVPTYVYWGQNDWMADPKDVMETADALPNVKLIEKIQDEKWSHTDFMWGIQANDFVYNKIIQQMKTTSITKG